MLEPETSTVLDMGRVKVDPAWALRVPANLALRRSVLPFACLEGRVQVACADESDVQSLQAVERYVELPITTRVADRESLQRVIHSIFSGPLTNRRTVGAPLRASNVSLKAVTEPDAEDIVALCDELMHAAVIREASDLHIDAGPEQLRIRLRVDGVLEDYRRLPMTAHQALTSRIKVLSGMDIAERRAPQDGRFSLNVAADREIDIRVASLPTRHGERMTLRFLATKTSDLTLEKLGMSNADLRHFQTAIDKPHGLILLTGPTGSGKSTTLYGAIRRLIATSPSNIITVEDPIEYEIDGVAQVEVDSADKVSFDKALRSILRNDPDVIMIGEIRDGETADIAIKAALTGHLVFSTLHTNSAANSVTRLVDMGMEPYLVGATLRLAVAQRLVRRLCEHCRKPKSLTPEQARALGRDVTSEMTIYEGGSCVHCAGRSYVGRLGIFEMLPIDEMFSRAISSGVSEPEIIEMMRQRELPRLVDDAIGKLSAGETSIHEALAAVTVW